MASPERASFRIRKLAESDVRTTFRSGNVELDRFFHRYAGQNQFRHHIGTTYVAVREDGFVAGFATIAASEIVATALPAAVRKRLPQYPLPVLRLARLAVDERAEGQGVGSLLLRAVLALAVTMRDDFGCVGVVVDSKPEAVPFYTKLGFTALELDAGQLGDRPEPLPMFLALGSLAS